MNRILVTAGAVLLATMSSLAAAANNPLSVHVLNLESGLPSPDVQVTLERLQGEQAASAAGAGEQHSFSGALTRAHGARAPIDAKLCGVRNGRSSVV